MWGLPLIRAPAPSSVQCTGNTSPSLAVPPCDDACASPSFSRRALIRPGSPAAPTRHRDIPVRGDNHDTAKSCIAVASPGSMTLAMQGSFHVAASPMAPRSMPAYASEAGACIPTNLQQTVAHRMLLSPSNQHLHNRQEPTRCFWTMDEDIPAVPIGSSNTMGSQPFWHMGSTLDCTRTTLDQRILEGNLPSLRLLSPFHHEECDMPSTPTATCAMHHQSSNPFYNPRVHTSSIMPHTARIRAANPPSVQNHLSVHRLAQASCAHSPAPACGHASVYDPMEALLHALTPINTPPPHSLHLADSTAPNSPDSFQLVQTGGLSRCNSWGSLASEPPGVAACNMYTCEEDRTDSSSQVAPLVPQRDCGFPVLQLPASPGSPSLAVRPSADASVTTLCLCEQDACSTPRVGISAAPPGAPKKPSAVLQPNQGSAHRMLRFPAVPPQGSDLRPDSTCITPSAASCPMPSLGLPKLRSGNKSAADEAKAVCTLATNAKACYAPGVERGNPGLPSAGGCQRATDPLNSCASDNADVTPLYRTALSSMFHDGLKIADDSPTCGSSDWAPKHATAAAVPSSGPQAPPVAINTFLAWAVAKGSSAHGLAAPAGTMEDDAGRPGGSMQHAHAASAARPRPLSMMPSQSSALGQEQLGQLWRRLQARFSSHTVVPV